MNPLDLLVAKLPDPPRKAPRRGGIERAFRARCPNCEGRGMSLSVAETSDGRLLLHCFAGCDAKSVLGVLGLSWDDVLPLKMPENGVRGNGGPASWGSLAGAVDALHAAHCRLLATCSLVMEAGEIEAALRALLAAGEAMQAVKDMSRRAMREGAK